MLLTLLLVTRGAFGESGGAARMPSAGGELKIRAAKTATDARALSEADGDMMIPATEPDDDLGLQPAAHEMVEPDWSVVTQEATRSPLVGFRERSELSAAPEAEQVRFASTEFWTWQWLPDNLIYQSYLAGVKEPRFASVWSYDRWEGWIWDVSLGGRVGLLRYGSVDRLRPEGWQLDMEGAAQPRLDVERSLDVMATDYRFGVPLTYGRGPYQTKMAFYHLSSHLGDELMDKHPEIRRINYSRNALVWGHSYYWTEALRLYGEAAWSFMVDGGAEPWEFQFGIDYCPPMPTGGRPVPFFAINGHLREDVNYGGNMCLQSGWLWRGESAHLLRVGMQYYTGKSDQYEFFNQDENKLGLGIWYDY